MATITWTLEVNNVVHSFEEWSASLPSVVFRSMMEDTANFIITGDVRSACPVTYGQRCRIFRRVDSDTPVCWFVGKITAITARATPRLSEWTIRASNFWFDLSATMFQQTCVSYDVSGCVKNTTKKTTKVVLYQDPRTGLRITTGQQIYNVIQNAIEAGIVVNVGSVPNFINVPYETARDLTLAEVIMRAMQFTPDAVSWVDYSSGAPVVYFQQRASLSTVSLDLAATTAVVESFELRKRDDLIPAGVRFNYIGFAATCQATVPDNCEDDTDGETNTTGGPITAAEDDQLTTITQDSVGSLTIPNAIIGTFDLAQISSTATETAPTGMANLYYISLLTPQWEGTLTTVEPECSGQLRPGKVLNLTNGNSDWTTMNAMIQEVSEDLDTGMTSVSMGPTNNQMAPQDFISLVQLSRRRALVTDAFTATRAPGADDTNCYAGKDPGAQSLINKVKANGAATAQGIGATNLGAALPVKLLQVCQDGVAGITSVYGPS